MTLEAGDFKSDGKNCEVVVELFDSRGTRVENAIWAGSSTEAVSAFESTVYYRCAWVGWERGEGCGKIGRGCLVCHGTMDECTGVNDWWVPHKMLSRP